MDQDWVRAQPTPQKLDMLQMAQEAAEAVYFKNDTVPGERRLPPGWQEVPHPGDPLGALLKTADAAHLLAPNGLEFIAFRGSVGSPASSPDWIENYKQGVGLYSESQTPKHWAAAEIGRRLQATPVTFAGHSLGGGLATLAAETASTKLSGQAVDPPPAKCVTFNAAAVNPLTIVRATRDVKLNVKSIFNAVRDFVTEPKRAKADHIVNETDAVNRVVMRGKVGLFTPAIETSKENDNAKVFTVRAGGGVFQGAGHAIKTFRSAQPEGPAKFTMDVKGSDRMYSHGEFDRRIDARISDASLAVRMENARGTQRIGMNRAQGVGLGN